MITLTALQLALLCAGAALGGAIFGVIGFAFGVVMSVFIHHAFAAPDVVFIVVGGAVALNLGLLPRFWREIRWREALPYLAGATLGLPIGLWLLTQLDPRTIRAFVAALVIGYGLFALRQHSRAPFRLRGAIGFTGGVIGGISGLGPLVPGVWFGLYVQGSMVAWLLVSGTVSRNAVEGVAIAAPVMLAAACIGLRGFDRLSTALFQRSVVILAVVGAAVLLARQLR